MAEIVFSLTLNRAQRSQLFAHLVVYLFCLSLNSAALRDKASFEVVQEVAYRLFYSCRDEHEEVAFPLSPPEGQALKDVFRMLKSAYEQWVAETSTLVLEDLTACCLLLQEAEQHAAKAKERA